jgi:hypothetical protein
MMTRPNCYLQILKTERKRMASEGTKYAVAKIAIKDQITSKLFLVSDIIL